MSDERRDIRLALDKLPSSCRYHDDIEPESMKYREYDGACCATGQPALLRRRALAALDRLTEVADRV